jgi:transcriptional regulator
MHDDSFAALVTQHAGVPFASHVPLILAADEGPYGTLYGHMAQSNAQWRDFDASQDVLVIFQGPHTYVSPSWYEADPTNVPTWNYAVVHAYGSPRLITDDDACQTLRMTHVEGKLKLSQNRSLADQQQVAETLQQSANPVSRDVGTLMQQREEARRTSCRSDRSPWTGTMCVWSP